MRHASEFQYDRKVGLPFEPWCEQEEDVFTVKVAYKEDETRVPLLHKLGLAELVSCITYKPPVKHRTPIFKRQRKYLFRFDLCSMLVSNISNCRERCWRIGYLWGSSQQRMRTILPGVPDGGPVSLPCIYLESTSTQVRGCHIAIPVITDQENNIKLQKMIDGRKRVENPKRESTKIHQKP